MSQIVLITGASSGFGEACARKFAAAGYALVLVARSFEKLQLLATELHSQVPIYCAQVDMMDAQAVSDFVQDLPQEFQAIDLLINNAGLALGLEPAQESNLTDWEVMIDTNIKGLVRMTRHILPGMVQRQRGQLINMGSIAGSWPYPGGNTYGATKAFVQQFSRNLRADLLGQPIRVTNLEPGMADTNFSNVRMKGDQARADKVYENTRPLTAMDIAEMVFWVASLPPHININTLEVMPTCQAWGPLAVSRNMV